MPEPLIFGNRSMGTVRRPLCGCFVLRAWWEASSESPWVFGDASRLHDLKRPSLFRRDKVLSRNAHRPSGFAFTHLKKFLRVPRGVFQKRALGRVREESHKRRYKHFQRGQPSKPGILRNPYKSLTEPWEKEEKDFAIL